MKIKFLFGLNKYKKDVTYEMKDVIAEKYIKALVAVKDE